MNDIYKIKITVKTPKNQAAKCIEKHKTPLLGVNYKHKIIEQKLLNDHSFYWILELDNDKDMVKIVKKCASGEVMIKKFYSVLFKLIGRANKLAGKFKKGFSWIRRWIVRQAKKKTQDEALAKQIEEMSDEDLREFIQIKDKTEMEKLLNGSLIEVKKI